MFRLSTVEVGGNYVLDSPERFLSGSTVTGTAATVLDAFTSDIESNVIQTSIGAVSETLGQFSSTATGKAFTKLTGTLSAPLGAFGITASGTVTGDLTAPVITVTGNPVVVLPLGDPYIEQGATWTDNVDGSGPAVIGGDTVDTGAVGVYIVTYDYTDTAGNVGLQQTRSITVSDVSIGSEQRNLNKYDFPATIYPRVNDIQIPLIRLKRLVRRSSPAVARQIENYIHSTYEAIKVTNIVGVSPNDTVPSEVNLKILYSIYVDYLRAERIKILNLLDNSNNSTIRHHMSRQLQLWLETQGWVFTQS